MRHCSAKSRAGSLAAAVALAAGALGFGVSSAQATFTYDVRLAPGQPNISGDQKTASVTAGQSVTLQIWGQITGAGTVGVQDAFYGVAGTLGTGGSTLSAVTAADVAPFNGLTVVNGTTYSTAYAGTTTNTNAAGAYVGPADMTNGTSSTGWAFARSTSMTTTGGNAITGGMEFLLGTANFTVGTLGTGPTTINAVARPSTASTYSAIWEENGAEVDNGAGGTGVIALGPAVSLVPGGAPPVQHIAGNTPFGNYDGSTAAEVVNLNDLNAVLNNLGTTNAAGYAWPRWNGQTSPGTVGLNDLNGVLNHLGTSTAGGAPLINGNTEPSGIAMSSSAVAVPEPASLGLLGLVGAALLGRRSRK